MKHIQFLFIALVFSTFTTNTLSAQQNVVLKNVTFSVPSEFYYFTEQDRQFDYEYFHEFGKIFTDSTNLQKSPKIQYQYYELPEFGLESTEKVLKDFNQTMIDSYPLDTLIIEAVKHYSLAKYEIMGKSLSEIKSLGKKGWLNIQYFDELNNDSINKQVMTDIIQSIQHNEVYESKYDKHMNESKEASKRMFIFLAIAGVSFLISRFIKKSKNAA